jgi:6-phosphogluconolactonase
MENKIWVLKSPDELADAVAKRWIELAEQSIKRTGAFHVALSGGSTPKKLFQLLARPEYAQQVQWQDVHVYFGDERAVPHDHPDSNYLMAREALLDHVSIPLSQIHPIHADPKNIRECADQYADILKHELQEVDSFPCLDLCLQGIGDDGHTASLFPDTDILDELQRSVTEVYVEKLKSWRISITFPVLENARTVLFLVSGGGKADILQKVLEGKRDTTFPVQRIKDRKEIEWYLDQAAASKLKKGEK